VYERQKSDSSACPLAGWRIVVTRSEGQADRLSNMLRNAGAEPLPYPTIAFAPPDDVQRLDDALQRLYSGGYDWLILTSVTGVRAVQARLEQFSIAAPGKNVQNAPFKLAAIGAATATACTELLGLQPAVVPEKFVAEALAQALNDLNGQRVLLAQAEMARHVLRDHLQSIGAQVDAVIAYRTVPASGGVDLAPLLVAGEVHAITFTSSSTVRFFMQRIGADALEHARRAIIACIGPITAQTARDAGLIPTVEAEPSTIEGLVTALIDYHQNQQPAHNA
jgi:uroporphyrinogen-III synthase